MTDTPESSSAPLEALQRRLDLVNRQLVQAELRSHATRAEIIDPEGLKLLDTSALKINDDGGIEGAAALVDQFKRDKPWLFPSRNSSHPAAAPAAEEPKPRTAKEMSYAEWRQARERLLRRK